MNVPETPPTTRPVEVYKKIHAVMKAANPLGSTGKHFKFGNYATIKDVEASIRPAMIEHGLILHSYMVGYDWIDGRYIIQFHFELIDIDSGQALPSTWYSESMTTGTTKEGDIYPDEMAVKKCITAATKSFLKSIFMLSSGDDDSPEVYQTRPDPEAKTKKAKVSNLVDEMEKRETRHLQMDFYRLLGSYFGDEKFKDTEDTRTSYAGKRILRFMGVESSRDLTIPQLTDLLAMIYSHFEKHGKTARPIVALWRQTDPDHILNQPPDDDDDSEPPTDIPGIGPDGEDLYDNRERDWKAQDPHSTSAGPFQSSPEPDPKKALSAGSLKPDEDS